MAASEGDRSDCQGDDPARMIRGCTRVIEDATESPSDRALALHMRGLAFVAKGDIDRAIADYNEAIRLNPNNGLAFNERALAYEAKGDFDRALADLNEAVKLDSGNADIHYNRGNLLMKTGDLDHAIADFNEAIRLGPANIVTITKDDAIIRLAIERIKADYYGVRGHAKFLQGKFSDAASDYARFAQFHRDEPSTILQLFLARARSGQPGGAAELQTGAAALKQPDWPFPVVELFLGRKTAVETLGTAATPDQRCQAQYYIGEWYLLRGETTAARPALQAAADTCPKSFDEYQLAQFELKRLGQ